MSEKFHVYQFFKDGSYEHYKRFVGKEEAVQAFQAMSSSVGAKIGTTQRVIITDMMDFTVAEWQFGKGVVWPKPDAEGQST